MVNQKTNYIWWTSLLSLSCLASFNISLFSIPLQQELGSTLTVFTAFLLGRALSSALSTYKNLFTLILCSFPPMGYVLFFILLKRAQVIDWFYLVYGSTSGLGDPLALLQLLGHGHHNAQHYIFSLWCIGASVSWVVSPYEGTDDEEAGVFMQV